MKLPVYTITIFLVVVILSGYAYWTSRLSTATNYSVATSQKTFTPKESVPNNSVVSTTTNTMSSPTAFSLEDVGGHANASSCWTAINGSVYDLTPWISEHPGGSREILKICGKDGSQAFNRQHGGQSGPESLLVGFKIGILKNN